MEKKKRAVWIIGTIAIISLIIALITNYNGLSKQETVEKFIDLVSISEYEQAKKYITRNFEWDLASVKKQKFEYKESFTYSYGNYKLDSYDEVVYININLKEIKAAEVVKFKLKKTILGLKIDDYKIDWIEY